jgi:hypothetical protein
MIRVAACSYEGSLFGWNITPNSVSTEATLSKTKGNKKSKEVSEQNNVELQFGLHISHGSFKTIAVSKNGKYLAVAGMTERIFLYNMVDNKEVGEIFGHSGAITSLAFYEDSYIFSASEDHTLNVWRVSDRQLLHILGGHKDVVNGFSIHPSGKLAISVSNDHTMKLWNLVQGRCSFTRRLRTNAESILWNAKGNYYLLSTPREVQLFDITNNNECKLEINTTSRINHVIFAHVRKEGEDGTDDETTRIVIICENNSLSFYNLKGELAASLNLTSINVGRLRNMAICKLENEEEGIVVVTSTGCMMILNGSLLETAYRNDSQNNTSDDSHDKIDSFSKDESIFGVSLHAFHQLKSDPRLTAVVAWNINTTGSISEIIEESKSPFFTEKTNESELEKEKKPEGKNKRNEKKQKPVVSEEPAKKKQKSGK